MSRSLNKVTLLGNLGADPDVRTTSGGGKVATFSLATGRQWTDAKGEKQEKTEWHKCVAWNTKGPKLADIVEKYVGKGDKVYVEGQIEYRSYEDKDKQTRYVTEINVREVLLLGGKGSTRPDASPSGRAEKPSGVGSGFEEFPAAMDGDDDLPF